MDRAIFFAKFEDGRVSSENNCDFFTGNFQIVCRRLENYEKTLSDHSDGKNRKKNEKPGFSSG